MASFVEKLQRVVRNYREDGQPWPASSRAIAAWAISQNLWQPQRGALISQCAEQLSRALREEYITDAQGRRVRTKHSARVEKHGEQLVLWDDIRTASRSHMRVAFQQRRLQIVGDCHQLKMDSDSFNENQSHSHLIQISFDFTRDLEELLALAA
jgi:hypothetical protein